MDIEAADKAIDALIEKRAAEKGATNWVSEEEERRLRLYRFKKGEANRYEWLDYHERQAKVFERLAAEHRQAVGKLIDLPAERRTDG